MLSWQAALRVVDTNYINLILSKSMGHTVYRQLASYFVHKNIGWLHATGIIKRDLPDFSGGTFGNFYHDLKQRQNQDKLIKPLGANETLDNDLYIEKDFKPERRYRYIGEFVYTDELTGKRVHEFKSYYGNDKLTKAEAGEHLFSSFDRNRYPEYRTLEYLKLVNIEHNVDWKY